VVATLVIRPNSRLVPRLSRVSHARRDAVQREEQRPVAVRIARALPPKQLDLKEGHRIHVRVAEGDRALERRVAVEQPLVVAELLQPRLRAAVLVSDAGPHGVARGLRRNPANPGWWDRDRFVLSAGHGSMLLYSLLHLTGCQDMTLDQTRPPKPR
jgi:hypothetical protein